MQKLSGLVLDVVDDPSLGILRSVFSSSDEMPEHIKTAHALTTDERRELPDDVFALVLQDGDAVLRKYACTDAGNTEVSVAYFLRCGGRLPEGTQKTAAANLVKACGWYGIDPPAALLKVAGLLGAAISNPGKTLSVGLGTVMAGSAAGEARNNLRDASRVGGRVVTPHQIQGGE